MMDRRLLYTLSGIGAAALLSSCGSKDQVLSPLANGAAGSIAAVGDTANNMAGDTASTLANEARTAAPATKPTPSSEPFSLRNGEQIVNHRISSGDYVEQACQNIRHSNFSNSGGQQHDWHENHSRKNPEDSYKSVRCKCAPAYRISASSSISSCASHLLQRLRQRLHPPHLQQPQAGFQDLAILRLPILVDSAPAPAPGGSFSRTHCPRSSAGTCRSSPKWPSKLFHWWPSNSGLILDLQSTTQQRKRAWNGSLFLCPRVGAKFPHFRFRSATMTEAHPFAALFF